MPSKFTDEPQAVEDIGGPVIESWPPVDDTQPVEPEPSDEQPVVPRATADTIKPGDTIVTRVARTVASTSTDATGITITFDDGTQAGPYQPGDGIEVG